MPSKMVVKVEMLYGNHLESSCHHGFSQKCSLYQTELFKLIHLQSNMLSSFIFTYFSVNHTNLPQKCHLGLKSTIFRT